MYLNARFDDGERLTVEIATVQGWGDFCRWARSLPGRFKVLHTLADKGTCANPSRLYDEIHAAAQVKKPGESAKAIANRLIDVTPDEGTCAVSEEPTIASLSNPAAESPAEPGTQAGKEARSSFIMRTPQDPLYPSILIHSHKNLTASVFPGVQTRSRRRFSGLAKDEFSLL